MRAFPRRQAALALAAVVLVFLACLTPFLIGHVRFTATHERRRLCMVAVIGTLAAYCDVHRRLPPAVVTDDNGTPLASWRLAVLPYSPAASTGPEDTQAMDFTTFDLAQAWDGSKNQSLTQQVVYFYCFRKESTNDATETNVFGITGPGTAFDANHRQSLVNLPPDTIVVIEVAGTRTPWAAPGDWDTARAANHAALIPAADGFYVAFADQSVWHLRTDVPFGTLSRFFQIDGAREHDRDQELSPYRIQ